MTHSRATQLLGADHLPLPYGLPIGSAAASDGANANAHVRAARVRIHLFRRHAECLPWAARGRDGPDAPWLDAVASWLDAVHTYDCAIMGYVIYSELPPAQLSEAVQAEWRRAVLEASPRELQEARPFLLTRPELVRMAEAAGGIEADHQAHNARVSRPHASLYRYAILLKDMAGYTIEGCPDRARWRSRKVQLGGLPAGRRSSHGDDGESGGLWLRSFTQALRSSRRHAQSAEDGWCAGQPHVPLMPHMPP